MDEPTSIRAGDSFSWRTVLTNYLPSAGWTLRYRLLQISGAVLEFNAAASNEGYDVSQPASTTASLMAGRGTLIKIVEKAGQRITLDIITVTILPDLVAALTFDSRSLNEKALADAEAALAATLAAGQGHIEEYEVAGRRMKFRTVQDIRDLINHYRRLVNKERAALAILSGGQPPGRCFYRG